MLQISKTPLRISFFGGGTDYKEYYDYSQGAVLGTTINKYIYLVALPMVGFADTRFRFTYGEIETVNQVEEIKHPVIRAVLQERNFNSPLNVAIISDMPGGTGLGSSSAFTVGFLNLIYRMQGMRPTKYDLAKEAIRIESEVLQEQVGIQDQIHAAFGGLSKYSFYKRNFNITPIRMSTDCREALNESLVLVHTGITRHASATLDEQISKTKEKKNDKDLSHLLRLTDQGCSLLEQSNPNSILREMGEMLNDAWLTKRNLSSSISNAEIDEIYTRAMELGAYGGKLSGAGGGGFFMFLASPEVQRGLVEVFGEKRVIKVEMDDLGSTIL